MSTPKRGRPPLNRPPVDKGTAELQAKRLALVGSGDPALSAYPLGILMAKGIIDQDQHNAGNMFANLYAKATGRMRQLGFETGNGEMDDEALAKVEQKYQACRDILIRNGRRCFDEVVNAAVYCRIPVWLRPNRYPRASWKRDREALTTGLDLLVGCLIGRKQAAE